MRPMTRFRDFSCADDGVLHTQYARLLSEMISIRAECSAAGSAKSDLLLPTTTTGQN